MAEINEFKDSGLRLYCSHPRLSVAAPAVPNYFAPSALSECNHRALRVTVSWLMAADVTSGSLLKTAAEHTCDHN